MNIKIDFDKTSLDILEIVQTEEYRNKKSIHQQHGMIKQCLVKNIINEIN